MNSVSDPCMIGFVSVCLLVHTVSFGVAVVSVPAHRLGLVENLCSKSLMSELNPWLWLSYTGH